MTQAIIRTHVTPITDEQEVQRVRFFDDTLTLANALIELDGPQFLSYVAIFPEDALKMVKKHRETKEPNPYLGSGLHKVQRAQASTNFGSNRDKIERRGGEMPATEGNWVQAVIMGYRFTPLSTHKEDVLTYLPEGLESKIANLRADLDEHGNVQFITKEPRLYLRYEPVRAGGDEPRAERKMRSESKYYLPNEETGVVEVDAETLEPYLPVRKPRTDETDYQSLTLNYVVEMRAGGVIWRRRVKE